MSITPRPPIPSFLPENAPFSPEQRAWLNGLFAGLYGLTEGVTPLTAQEVAQLVPGVALAPTAEIDDGAPWHDPAMPLVDRMKLAEGKPLPRRMMAAMAQQDCGQCGYNCKDYSDAIFVKKEGRLNLCVPGGKETARMLKELYRELETPGAAPPAEKTAAAPPAKLGYSRDNPVVATLAQRHRLNKDGSQKETWHIELDLAGTELAYEVGDSLGIYPINDPGLVDAVIAALGAPPDFPIGGRTLRETLSDGVSLSPAPDMLFQLISFLTGGDRRKTAKALASGQDPDGDAATPRRAGGLAEIRRDKARSRSLRRSARPLAAARLFDLVLAQNECRPRFAHGRCGALRDQQAHPPWSRLDFPRGPHRARERVRVYVQKAQHFALPADPNKPIIMIGPGTGIAPFRAFLQERLATNAPGPNWLYFGHQRSDYDFFYEEELKAMRKSGHLTRLTLAWSRDGDEKIYVQNRMRDDGRDLWAWLERGAHIYVCGDALRMAKDVERALIDVVAEHGKRSPEDAARYVAELKKNDRYQVDVY